MKLICKACKYYVNKSSLINSIFNIRSDFSERCTHPDCADEVDGSPRPCITMRLKICEYGRLFEPKLSEGKK